MSSCVFELHPQLDQDSLLLGSYPLCMLRMLNTGLYPWFLLIPRRMSGEHWLGELHDLDSADQQQWLLESMDLSRQLAAFYQPDKLNIASIGNRVPQLHIHHVVRFASDPAWPGVVWGQPLGDALDAVSLASIRRDFLPALGQGFVMQGGL